MPQVTITGQWKLITKRTIGDKGYTFQAAQPSIHFPAGSGCVTATTVIPVHITLVVNVVESGSQRIYFELDDAATDETGPWTGYALITPVEDEDLDQVTSDWQTDIETERAFQLDFRLVSASLKAKSIFGKLPQITPATPSC